MFYARMSMEKIKSPFAFAGKAIHNLDYGDKRKKLKHVDSSKTHLNRILIAVDQKYIDAVKPKDEEEANKSDEWKKKSYYRAVASRIKDAGCKKRNAKSENQSSVLGIEVVMNLNRDDDVTDKEKWIEANLKYLKENFGEENVISAVLHEDEQGPHIHAIVVPIRDGRLCGSYYMGNNKRLSEQQDIYAEYVKDLGLQRGVKNVRGTANYKDIKRYYTKVSEITEQTLEKPQKGQKFDDWFNETNKKWQDAKLVIFRLEEELEKEKNRNTNLSLAKQQSYENEMTKIALLRETYSNLIDSMADLKEKYNINPERLEAVVYAISKVHKYLKTHPEKKDEILSMLNTINELESWGAEEIEKDEMLKANSLEKDLETINENEIEEKTNKKENNLDGKNRLR